MVSVLHHIATKLIQSQVLNLFIKLDFDMLKSKDNYYVVAQLHAVTLYSVIYLILYFFLKLPQRKGRISTETVSWKARYTILIFQITYFTSLAKMAYNYLETHTCGENDSCMF